MISTHQSRQTHPNASETGNPRGFECGKVQQTQRSTFIRQSARERQREQQCRSDNHNLRHRGTGVSAERRNFNWGCFESTCIGGPSNTQLHQSWVRLSSVPSISRVRTDSTENDCCHDFERNEGECRGTERRGKVDCLCSYIQEVY